MSKSLSITEECEKEATEKVNRFWECFEAIKESGASGQEAYAEAVRQLGYEPPYSATALKYYMYLNS